MVLENVSSLKDSEDPSPAITLTEDYLKDKGVSSLGDIDSIVLRGQLISEAEEQAQIEERKEDGKARRRIALLSFLLKEALVYSSGVILVITLAAGSTFIMFQNSSSAQEKEWARAMLSAIGGAVAGYVFGKGSGDT